jgi:vancomycin resistance protein YoaR
MLEVHCLQPHLGEIGLAETGTGPASNFFAVDSNEQAMGTSELTLASRRVPLEAVPTRLSSAIFRLKVFGHRLRRTVRDMFDGPAHLPHVNGNEYTVAAGESRTALWSDDRAAEAAYQRGKVHNLLMAVEALDGILILPGRVFSFWTHIGRASKSRGYVKGRMLQQGCMMGAVGGGLCQLSNALYDVALQTGCEIVERHAHSRLVPGSATAQGRDATVAWNYVDLRFRAPQAIRIRARVVDEHLVVSFCVRAGTQLAARRRHVTELSVLNRPAAVSPQLPASTCGTCGRTSCFRKEN